MRIDKHPILSFNRGKRVVFYYNGDEVIGYENETVAAALHAAGHRCLSVSSELHRPRGLYCAIGNCASCFMTVDDQPNQRVCVIKCRKGMRVERQGPRGKVKI